MGAVLPSESRRLYSWWWDSHISPKNSKWLQENLTDMDVKVKAMIKLIEEDADSFARRAEMYYKKRPELMKLVEEFYRAYRALAERYDHANMELRYAQRTMAEAFPNQVPFVLGETSPAASTPEVEPRTPEMLPPICASVDQDHLDKDAVGLSPCLHFSERNGSSIIEYEYGIRNKGLEQLDELFGPLEAMSLTLKPVVECLNDGQKNLRTQTLSESDCESMKGAETVVEAYVEALAKIKSEKKAIFLQYKQSLERLANLDRELSQAQSNARALDEKASKAETEVRALRDALVILEAERDAWLLQHKQCMESISNLETMVSQTHSDNMGHTERVIRAETEAHDQRLEVSRLEAEKEANLLEYQQCLEKVLTLEDKISSAEDGAQILVEQASRAELEVQTLMQALSESIKEKEAMAVKYKHCMEMISKLESEICLAQEDSRRFGCKLSMEKDEIKRAKEQSETLQNSNNLLQLKADDVVQKMVMKNQELLKKYDEFEKLQIHLQNEHSRFLQVEASLQTLQDLHTQSQEEYNALVSEIKNVFQMLKDLGTCKRDLEVETRRVNKENQRLSDFNLFFSASLKNMQGETMDLGNTKGKLEEEVVEQLGQIDGLRRDIFHLKEGTKSLNGRYQALLEQVKSVGLDHECLSSSVMALWGENSDLMRLREKDKGEMDTISRKLENMETLLKNNAVLERSLSEVREKIGALQASYQSRLGEKSTLVYEEAVPLSKSQIIPDDAPKLQEKNNHLLDHSLSAANVELEGLREKSKSLEECCSLLHGEKFGLLTEGDTMVSGLETVEERLERLEKRFTELEDRYADPVKANEQTHHQIEGLKACLAVEKRERASIELSSEAILKELKNHINLLQEESRGSRKGFEEELDKAVDAQIEILVLQGCVQDMGENNLCLLNECQRHINASKFSEQLISQLEWENLGQQAELKVVLDEIEKLKAIMMYAAVFTDVQIDSENKIEEAAKEIIPQIRRSIEHMKSSLLGIEDERQQLLVENSVLLALIGGLGLEVTERESEWKITSQRLKSMREQFTILEDDKVALQEFNGQLMVKVRERDIQEGILKAEKECLQQELLVLQGDFEELRRDYYKNIDENISLSKEFFKQEEEKCSLVEDYTTLLQEAVSFDSLSLIYHCLGTEKGMELNDIADDLNNCLRINCDLRKQVELLKKELEMEEEENSHLNGSLEKLHKELYEARDFNDQVNRELLVQTDLLTHKERELSELDEKLINIKDLNMELCKTIGGLETGCEELKLEKENLRHRVTELSIQSSNQHKEIERLHEVNGNLESAMGVMDKEIEQFRIKEENLSSQLLEKSNGYELWESEAAAFYFDLQVSTVHEVLFVQKVHELASVCQSLEDESASKSMELEDMREKVCFLEGEIGGLKTQLSAYNPVIHSLGDSIASLEHVVQSLKKLLLVDDLQQKDVEVVVDYHVEPCEDQAAAVSVGVSDLEKMQTKIKEIEKAMAGEMQSLAMQESLITSSKLEAALKEIGELKSKNRSDLQESDQKVATTPGDGIIGDPDLQQTDPESKGTLMKDILLDQVTGGHSFQEESRGRNVGSDDQMLELWEHAEKDFHLENEKLASAGSTVEHQFDDTKPVNTHASPELQAEKELSVDKLEVSTSVIQSQPGNEKSDILERLASNTQTLQILQMGVQDLKRKMETRNKGVEFEAMKEELHETEKDILQLVDINSQLAPRTEDSPLSSVEFEETGNDQRKRLMEEVQQGSKKIERLKLEVEKMQYVWLKLENETKSKGTNRFTMIRTRKGLSNFVYCGRSSERRRKGCFCGC